LTRSDRSSVAFSLDALDNEQMRLIERGSQLAALHQYADEASHAQGRLVLVSGEAGIGKSALLEDFAEQSADARWLWAGCDGLFTPAALGPLLDIAVQLEGELLRLCQVDSKRDQLYGALLRQLNGLKTLTVIAVEDVHWADEATLDLLSYLGRRIQHLRALLLVTYRDDALVSNDQLRLTLGGLASQRVTRRLGLSALSAAGVATLAHGTEIDAAELHRLTAGNPFFVTEVLQAGNDGLPASVRDAVLARTRTLSVPARDALEVAALIGPRMRSELLVSLIDNPLVTDELISHGLLIKDGDDLRFRHEIARVAIEGAIPPYRKAAIHTTIIEALLSSGSDDDARLAFHAEGAGNAELVLTHAPRAGRRAAALGARREAAAQYERALRFVPETDIRTRAELLDNLGEQLDFSARWQDHAETRSEAAALWHELGDFARESDSLLALAWGLWKQCRGADFGRTADAALRLAKPLGRSPQLANAYITLAYRHMIKSRYQDGLALLQHAREMSEQLGLGDVISDSLNVEARIVRAMGNDWTVPIRAALEIALSGGHELRAGNAFANMYWMYFDELRHEEAEQIYHEALAYCDVHDIGTSADFLLGVRAEAFEKLGRWDECLSIAHARLDDQSLSPAGRLAPLTYQAKVMARRGQNGYWPYLDEALRFATGYEEPMWLLCVHLARSEAYWLEGRTDAAVEELDRIGHAFGGVMPVQRGWLALWTQRLTGIVDPIDLEPFASQLSGNGARAVELWDRLGYRYEAALALLDTKDEANLRESLSRLVDLGAEATARLVRRTMRDLGIRGIPAGARMATKTHPRGLTAREQQILQLLAEGNSNEEISRSLFISVRTVENHVSAILIKLGTDSRKGAAKEARRLGLTPQHQSPVAAKSK
jgi:DNA-binding CsgD family transcriptional regulator/tetratricopeptide (TPR) repeat protein